MLNFRSALVAHSIASRYSNQPPGTGTTVASGGRCARHWPLVKKCGNWSRGVDRLRRREQREQRDEQRERPDDPPGQAELRKPLRGRLGGARSRTRGGAWSRAGIGAGIGIGRPAPAGAPRTGRPPARSARRRAGSRPAPAGSAPPSRRAAGRRGAVHGPTTSVSSTVVADPRPSDSTPKITAVRNSARAARCRHRATPAAKVSTQQPPAEERVLLGRAAHLVDPRHVAEDRAPAELLERGQVAAQAEHEVGQTTVRLRAGELVPQGVGEQHHGDGDRDARAPAAPPGASGASRAVAGTRERT